MKNRKVISYKNLPSKIPLLSSAVAYLLLEKFNAAGWVWGVFITLFSLIWIVMIYGLATEETTDVFKKAE